MDEDYVSKKVSWFEAYVDQELDILEDEGVVYTIAYHFLETMVRRIRLYVNQNAQQIPPLDLPETYRKKYLQQRHEYLTKVTAILTDRSRRYDPLDGSFWEDVSKALLELARFAQAWE